MNLDVLKFYYGTETDYNKLIEEKSDLFINSAYFYYTEDEKGNHKLRLNDKIIYDDSKQEELKSMLTNYLSLVAIDEQTINSDLILNNKNLTANNISAKSLEIEKIIQAKDEDEINIPFEGLSFSNAKLEGGNILNMNIQQEESNLATTLHNVNIKSWGTMVNYKPNDNVNYEFNDGKITIDTLYAKQIFIEGQEVSADNQGKAYFDSIQIGDIVLSAENGELKISAAPSSIN